MSKARFPTYFMQPSVGGQAYDSKGLRRLQQRVAPHIKEFFPPLRAEHRTVQAQ